MCVCVCTHLLIKELASEEMATKEKQKKRSLFTSFYKLSSKPKSQPAVAAAAVSRSQLQQQSHSHTSVLQNFQETEPAVLRSKNNMVLKKLEGCEQIEHGGRRSVDRGGGGRGINNYVEARKSVSHVETNMGTNLASVISFLQVKVLVSDMPGFMQVHAFRCARTTYDSLEKFSSKHIAFNIKKVRVYVLAH